MRTHVQDELDLALPAPAPRRARRQPQTRVRLDLGSGRVVEAEKWGLGPLPGTVWLTLDTTAAFAVLAGGRRGRMWQVRGLWAGNTARPLLASVRPHLSPSGAVHVGACPTSPPATGTSGSPGAERLVADIAERLDRRGWVAGCGCLVAAVIDAAKGG